MIVAAKIVSDNRKKNMSNIEDKFKVGMVIGWHEFCAETYKLIEKTETHWRTVATSKDGTTKEVDLPLENFPFWWSSGAIKLIRRE
jgi:hypothetical protein